MHSSKLFKLGTTVLGLVMAASSSLALAQETKVKFQLDWRFEGPAALFLVAKSKGYFAQEKLDVTIDAGNGSGNAVNRVASGTYDMGFADMAALMEFTANNPDAPGKPVAVMMVYNDTPAAVFSLKKSGIKKPADLAGKKLGAPVFDAGRRAYPIFAKANGLDATKAQWTSMDPPLRETMLARGDVDAITGFYFTSLLNLNARGIKDEDINVMMYPDYGVRLYGNTIIASETMVKQKPEAIKGFLRAFAKASRDVMANPEAAIKVLKERDGLIDEKLELRRLKLAIASAIATPHAKAEGYGQVYSPRLTLMASQVSDAYGTKTRVNADKIWNGSFLPSKAELDVFPK
ncbi:ABC transporter substrate-binding protein [Herbaspirillum sp.]|uniref:ABC transporter substrate-binding protein n=1 Tax=Herbaspirillum TaxID=963 RepID=UPI002590EE40|nr:ABC transporter substrate-binding protein [Herbaspirillum sp.]MCP3654309.1 ABC transporter substrate-binding protein [Herbaspirillum sp.]MCP3946207.1 ABC transporter substrate-binding protein [Herbaspirillum sp.]MCP4031838.1 ABC transporter substrate-binding protein [Herbaspirillum sp.]MCP4555214.1 ABC transporter substrate-binding protein [Herbaspirillum sp.]